MIKLLYVPSLNVPVCYWRIENYAEQFVRLKSKMLVNVEYFRDIIEINMAWDHACVGKGDISKQIQTKLKNAFKFFDIIIFQRIQNVQAIALIEQLRMKYPDTRIVAELDDSVGEVSPSSPYNWGEHHRWSAEHLYRSDAVICSTEYLANSIKPIIGEKPCHVAPNCINRNTWKFKRPQKPHEGYNIGYTGGGGHDEDLRIVYRAITPLLDQFEDMKLIIRYGGYRPRWLESHKNIDFKSVAWCMDEYPQRLADMDLDLALAPLRDSEFNRCKSNLKWLEWASMDVPLLASNVEPYKKTKGTIWLVSNDIRDWQDTLFNFYTKRKQGDMVPKIDTNKPVTLPDDPLARKPLHKQIRVNNNLHAEALKLFAFLENLL